MKDNKEIIEITQKCLNSDCDGCDFRKFEYCRLELLKNLFCVVNRQQADNERMKKLLEEADVNYNKCAKRFYKEGVKEFTKRLKDYYINHKRYKRPYAHTQIDFLFGVIDDLVKEMVGNVE